MRFSFYGLMAILFFDFMRSRKSIWLDLINHNKNIELHDFVVMPNHVHEIIEIIASNRAGSEPTPTSFKLPEMIRQFKTFSAKRINQRRNTVSTPIWQRNYHEHIIRDITAYLKTAEYIQTKPQKWLEDLYYKE